MVPAGTLLVQDLQEVAPTGNEIHRSGSLSGLDGEVALRGPGDHGGDWTDRRRTIIGAQPQLGGVVTGDGEEVRPRVLRMEPSTQALTVVFPNGGRDLGAVAQQRDDVRGSRIARAVGEIGDGHARKVVPAFDEKSGRADRGGGRDQQRDRVRDRDRIGERVDKTPSNPVEGERRRRGPGIAGQGPATVGIAGGHRIAGVGHENTGERAPAVGDHAACEGGGGRCADPDHQLPQGNPAATVADPDLHRIVSGGRPGAVLHRLVVDGIGAIAKAPGVGEHLRIGVETRGGQPDRRVDGGGEAGRDQVGYRRGIGGSTPHAGLELDVVVGRGSAQAQRGHGQPRRRIGEGTADQQRGVRGSGNLLTEGERVHVQHLGSKPAAGLEPDVVVVPHHHHPVVRMEVAEPIRTEVGAVLQGVPAVVLGEPEPVDPAVDEVGGLGVVDAIHAVGGDGGHFVGAEPSHGPAFGRVEGRGRWRVHREPPMHGGVPSAVLAVDARANRIVRGGLPLVRMPQREVVPPLVGQHAGQGTADPRVDAADTGQSAVAGSKQGRTEDHRAKVEVRGDVGELAALGDRRREGQHVPGQERFRAAAGGVFGLGPGCGKGRREDIFPMQFPVAPPGEVVDGPLQMAVQIRVGNRLIVRGLVGKAHADQQEPLVSLGVRRRDDRRPAAARATSPQGHHGCRIRAPLLEMATPAEPDDLVARRDRLFVVLGRGGLAGNRADRIPLAGTRLGQAEIPGLFLGKHLDRLIPQGQHTAPQRVVHRDPEDPVVRGRDLVRSRAVDVGTVVLPVHVRDAEDRLVHRGIPGTVDGEDQEVAAAAHRMLDLGGDDGGQGGAEGVRKGVLDRPARIQADELPHGLTPRVHQLPTLLEESHPLRGTRLGERLRPAPESIQSRFPRPGGLRHPRGRRGRRSGARGGRSHHSGGRNRGGRGPVGPVRGVPKAGDRTKERQHGDDGDDGQEGQGGGDLAGGLHGRNGWRDRVWRLQIGFSKGAVQRPRELVTRCR